MSANLCISETLDKGGKFPPKHRLGPPPELRILQGAVVETQSAAMWRVFFLLTCELVKQAKVT